MPVDPTYPGVYIQEDPSSGVHTIMGVPTDIAAFVGRARTGPVDDPQAITSLGDFIRVFGGLWSESMLGFAVQDFFLNGGERAVVVRVFSPTGDGGNDGKELTENDFAGPEVTLENKKGLYALEKTNLFNMLYIPPFARNDNGEFIDVPGSLLAKAVSYCESRRAILLVDPPSIWQNPDSVTQHPVIEGLGPSANAAIYFPRLMEQNPLLDNQIQEFGPCPAVAGVIARTDLTGGVWKAPAGLKADLRGVSKLGYVLTDEENGRLNPNGVNCLRTFIGVGNVVWGARTMRGDDRLNDEWKYLPVRRLALYIEASIERSTKWAVFEANDEPLWSQLRLNVGAFMHDLFRAGAFQGRSPSEAYFVKCDAGTTPQNDQDVGIVNILVGFAPLKPTEFVILAIQQMAGQIAV